MTDVPTVKIIEKMNALKAEVRFHKEIAEAREFDFHEAEKQIAIEKAENASLRELLFIKDARIAELKKTCENGETKSAQAYQVIGALASLASCFEHSEVIRALDYFASDRFDPEFLPFASGTISADLERDGYKLVKFTVSERPPFVYDGRE